MSTTSLKTSAMTVLMLIALLLPSSVLAAGGRTSAGGSSSSLRSDWGGGNTLQAKKGSPGKGKNGNPGKGGKGNAGKGNSGKPDRGKHEDKGKSDKGKKDKPGKGPKAQGGNQKVVPIATNAVSVACATDAAAGSSTCSFSATGPNGPTKVKVLYVPESVACSSVVETTGAGATIDGVPAFASRKNKPDFSIVLTGTVSVGGNATYWVEAGKQLVPVSGQGLTCAETVTAVPATATPTVVTSATQEVPTQSNPTQTAPTQIAPTETASTTASATDPATLGSIEIRTGACADAMTDPEADWFRSCPDGATGLQFHLKPVEGEGTGLTAITDENGRVQFHNLQPGTYVLNLVDIDWCHAESDSVDADGHLVVGTGETVTVWIFTCNRP